MLGPVGGPGGVEEGHQGVLGQVVRRRCQGVVDGRQGQVRGIGLRADDLPGGKEGAGLPLGGAPLGHRVEEAHGVDLVPPELHAHRQVQAGGEHVQNAPPQGELAGSLHLVAAGVPGGDQEIGQIIQIADLAHGAVDYVV